MYAVFFSSLLIDAYGDCHDIFSQGVVLATVVVLIPLINGVDSSTHDRVCDNESHVKLSVIKGLHDSHIIKANRIHEFEEQVKEAEKEVDKAKLKVAQIQALVNKTINDADKMSEKMENMSTPELMELEEQQICSEDAFVTDCCQVKKLKCTAF